MKIDKKTTGEFIDLYNSGLSSEKIAKKYGTTRQTVLRHLKSNGVEVGIYQTNNNKIVDIFSESLKKNILKRYSEQETINDISETLNIKRNQVLLILNDLHVIIIEKEMYYIILIKILLINIIQIVKNMILIYQNINLKIVI